jgi:protein-disulfide isomerase
MVLIGVIVGFVGANIAGTGGLSAPSPSGGSPPPAPPAQVADARPTIDIVTDVAEAAGIDGDKFRSCVESGKYADLTAKDMSEGSTAGINGTPGNIVFNMKAKKGKLVSGAQPFENFKAEIDRMLGTDSTPSTAQDAGTVSPIDPKTDHIRGNPNASVAVIEYSDYQCPFCKAVHPTYQKIMDTYGDDVMWVYRHYPLPFHPHAQKAAEGGECAAELGGNDAFWKYTDQLFESGALD